MVHFNNNGDLGDYYVPDMTFMLLWEKLPGGGRVQGGHNDALKSTLVGTSLPNTFR